MSFESFSTLKVLVVDDNRNMRGLLRTLLNNFGIRDILEAADGDEGFRLFQLSRVDIVLCDLNMEPVDGFEMIQRIRNHDISKDPYVPVIVLTGHAEPVYVKRARDAGMNEFMVKPITADALRKRLNMIMENPRPFVSANSYFGPDRRRKPRMFDGPERRGDYIR